jgi:hypothetical protein
LDSNSRAKLYDAAVEELEKVDAYLKYLKEENLYLQTLFA